MKNMGKLGVELINSLSIVIDLKYYNFKFSTGLSAEYPEFS